MRVKNVQTTPPAPTASAVGPWATVIRIVGQPGTGSLPSTIAPPDHPGKTTFQWSLLVMYDLWQLQCKYEGMLKSSEPDQEHVPQSYDIWYTIQTFIRWFDFFTFRFICTNLEISSTSTFFMKMDRTWHRDVIKYLHKRGLAPKDVHADILLLLVSIVYNAK